MQMTTQQAIDLAKLIVAEAPNNFDDDDLYGDLNLMACAHSVWLAPRVEEHSSVAASRFTSACNAFVLASHYSALSQNEGYRVYDDGSVATRFQGDDYCYATLADFLADFPGQADLAR